LKPLSGATLELVSGASFPVPEVIDAGIIVKIFSGSTLTLAGAPISTGAQVQNHTNHHQFIDLVDVQFASGRFT
jgi:hypothetical protein